VNVDELGMTAGAEVRDRAVRHVDPDRMLLELKVANQLRSRRRAVLAVAAAALLLAAATHTDGRTSSGSVPSSLGGPTQTTTQSGGALPALTETFTSPLNSYTISYPDGWSVHPATNRWTYPLPGPNTPAQGEDELLDPHSAGVLPGTPGWGISAQVIPAQMTDSEWLSWYVGQIGTSTSCNPPLSRYQPVVIDGHPGAIHGGLVGCNFTEAVVVANHVGYIFAAYPNTTSATDQVYPPALFAAMLNTIHLGRA